LKFTSSFQGNDEQSEDERQRKLRERLSLRRRERENDDKVIIILIIIMWDYVEFFKETHFLEFNIWRGQISARIGSVVEKDAVQRNHGNKEIAN